MKFLIFALTAFLSLPAQGKILTVTDLVKVKRVFLPAVTPDYKTVFFTVTSYDAKNNSSDTAIFKTDFKGLKPVRITPVGVKEWAPSVSRNGKMLAFIRYTPKDKKGPQLWIMDIKSGKARKVTDTYASVSAPLVWSPDSKRILFNSSVHKKCMNMECVEKEATEKKPTGAQLFDTLLYRHWNHWRNHNINQLFSADVKSGQVSFELGVAINTWGRDVPPVALGGAVDYAISPDGKEISFAMNTDRLVAKSTNNDVFTYRSRNKNAHQISKSKGNDFSPTYSPDNRYIAFLSMARAGYEADKAVLTLFDRRTRKLIPLTDRLDLSVSQYAFAPDEKRIYFTTQEKGRINMYSTDFRGTIRPEFKNTFITDFIVMSRKKLLILNQTIRYPQELYLHDGKTIKDPDCKVVAGKCPAIRDNSKLVEVSAINKELMAPLKMNDAEEMWVNGSGGDKVHVLILKPPSFDSKKRYPVVFLIHGGPQGAFGYDFHPRWNSQLFASPGYVVVMVNFHGSTGYGMKFQDAIRGDWGGGPYKDIMAAFDEVSKLSYIDKNRIGAAGASYGGYMINWIGTKNNKFKCLISHSGVFNIESMYGSTEELWFPEWENKGTPWENRETYRKWSPHQYVQNWKTPTLVVHGAKDFRVTIDQGMQLFTSLQRLGVPSKFLYFPNEDHFVFQPANRILWWNTVHKWLAKYLTPGK